MTYKKASILLAASIVTYASAAFAKNAPAVSHSQLCFLENNGQITDQYHATRHDIQYALQAPGMNVFIGNGQLHYQFSRLHLKYPDLVEQLRKDYTAHEETVAADEPTATVETYRMDVSLIGANISAKVVADEKTSYYENYYLADCPDGIQAHSCRKIIYKNVYKGIDWVIYLNGGKLEHEFVVGPGGNPADIRLQYSGHTSIQINDDGSISATTPMGVIKEQAPVCYDENGNTLQSAFRLNGNVLTYNVAGYPSGAKLSPHHKLIIDPVLEWGTYYGPDSNNTNQYGITTDGTGKIYSCGLTYSPTTGNIATVGSYQATYGGNCDAFVFKFDSSGNRIWGTFYGGPNGDWGNDITYDKLGGLYMAGTTQSSTAISSAGTQQITYGGGTWDGFLVKFTTSGTRSWATYAGGTGIDYPESVACDSFGHVYLSGMSDSYTNIATAGSTYPTHSGGHDDFLIQYNTSNGLRQWGTYYGGNSDEFNGVVACDGNYVYLAGYTASTTGISTGSAFQPANAGGTDMFLVKFSPTGTRLWATYYGGPQSESVGGITLDSYGSLYILGATGSDAGIATPGAQQTVRAGATDAFLAKFNPEFGSRDWCTYYGGPGDENTSLSRICGDKDGNVYICGYTASTTGIAAGAAWQTTYGGLDYDAFLAKYSTGGVMYWSTYYGGNGTDQGKACGFDGKNVYLVGCTTSSNQIATPGSFLDASVGGAFYYQGFLAKFIITDTTITLQTPVQQNSTSAFTIYPNPNNGSFTLHGDLQGYSGTVRLSITDATGRVVMEGSTDVINGSLSKQVIPGSMPAGCYFLKASYGGKEAIARFVRE